MYNSLCELVAEETSLQRPVNNSLCELVAEESALVVSLLWVKRSKREGNEVSHNKGASTFWYALWPNWILWFTRCCQWRRNAAWSSQSISPLDARGLFGICPDLFFFFLVGCKKDCDISVDNIFDRNKPNFCTNIRVQWVCLRAKNRAI